ncbi:MULTISPECIES: N-acetylglucosamine/diacetylchitobiose ABC transporter substrate-binding protein [Arthrobacter]|uniref:Carbohydrate ABC transporter, N-acetylglucosamine/diacetylchitobiose-binding protein n=1 Tax=Arthrobacter psychrochitiniphilus TaxID=291045 RepID=A0A2V3DUY3_9MICC|nr:MULTISPECIES: N-acetylglucosamine/diacetylchitobiose ABC transporter substrate-binding protein [Arthrobacter]NYG15499.1 N-acetylglucosamine transport system substrate-binding protein [Arthrobacter psychrochitiniphilus]PXA66992.1 carbohydrate ABC transporter, N-acetylglucosamine/diacetylchitobiose-binding protein [Arthrobacter psychrochitiniphilus]
MSIQNKPLQRRGFLRGALATAVLLPLGGALASCAGGNNAAETSAAPGGDVDPTKNPFGVAATGKLDAVIFNGGYGIDYVEFAGAIVKKNFPELEVGIKPSTDIAQELQPRFVGGNPPDLIDNSGAKSIGFSTILDQLEDLQSVVDANNLEGTKIADTLFDGVLAPGTFDGKLAAINYVLTVYAWWYSASLFKDNGWTVPTTWDEAYDLGLKAKEKGKFLFVFGKEAATYYQTMAIESAIKEGGDEVRLSLENLKPDCWSMPAVQSVFTAMEKIVKAGMFKPGGAGTVFTAAQAQWSNGQEALLYPSGSWIENEMKDQTKAGFEMTGAPVPVVSASPKIAQTGVRSAGGEPFIIPAKGANVAAGKELLRTMLSKEAATNFAKEKLAPTVVKGTVPADGFGSTALVSQTTMLEKAGKDIFTWNFVDTYGMNGDQLVPWNSFLDGKLDVAGLTKALQEITDKVAKDDSVKKIEVK